MAKKDDKDKRKTQREINLEYLEGGSAILARHPLFGRFVPREARVTKNEIGSKTICIVDSSGIIRANVDYTLPPKQETFL